MAAVIRGVAYLVFSLLAFLNAMLALFLALGTFKSRYPGSQMAMEGKLTLFDGCIRLTDCDDKECYERNMCANFNSVECSSERATYMAAQAFAILTVLSIVPGIVMGALDALGKLPEALCFSQRGLLIAKAAGTVLLDVVLFILVLNLLYSPDYCKRLELERIDGFSVGAVVYLVASTLVFTVFACLAAIFVKPDAEKQGASGARRARQESDADQPPGGPSTGAGSRSAEHRPPPPTIARRRPASTTNTRGHPSVAEATDHEMRSVHSPVSGMPTSAGTFGTFESNVHTDG